MPSFSATERDHAKSYGPGQTVNLTVGDVGHGVAGVG